MSDLVTNVEIEDVLSSIRRLVAEEDSVVMHHPPADPVPAVSLERFVLTPALRVTTSLINDVQVNPLLSLELPKVADHFVALKPLILSSAAEVKEPLSHRVMSVVERASLEATIANLEAAVTDERNEWEPDGSEKVEPSALTHAFANFDTNAFITQGYVNEFSKDEAQTVSDDLTPQDVFLEPELTFKHREKYDPHVDYGDDLLSGDDDGIRIPDDLNENIAAYLIDKTSLDEASLRDMIVDVVRQELQGELGNRITRNVRKLVRQEINNALSSKPFT